MAIDVLKISETPILEILQGEENVLLSAQVQDESGAETETILRVSVNELIEVLQKKGIMLPYIGDNGNWFVYDSEAGMYVDSGQASKGEQGEKGEKGETGDNGISCKHSWNGTVLTIKSASGESSVDLKGEKGDKGDAPICGTDYFTPDEQETFAENIKTDVVTELSAVITETGDVETYEMELLNNHVTSMGIVSQSLTVTIGEAQNFNHTSAIYFTTPSAIPENYTTFPESVHFKGDGTSGGAFTPEANMRYTIIFDYDGKNVVAYVSEVSAV